MVPTAHLAFSSTPDKSEKLHLIANSAERLLIDIQMSFLLVHLHLVASFGRWLARLMLNAISLCR